MLRVREVRDFVLDNDIVTSGTVRSNAVALRIASTAEFPGASAFSFTLSVAVSARRR